MKEVTEWLASLSLKNDYSKNFEEAGFDDLDAVALLKIEELKSDLNISLLADRKKIEAAINKLNNPPPSTVPPNPEAPPATPATPTPISTHVPTSTSIANITTLPTPPLDPVPVQVKKSLALLFIGETGAGKTTLINSFYFFAQNKPLDQLEALVRTKYLPGKTAGSESNSSNQNQSQTTKAGVHTFILDTPNVQYEVKIMDTPGIGDTRGLEQDDDNITEIVSTVEKTPELNAVFLILNGAQARLTTHVSYVIQKLKGMLPNVFRDNLFLILTNSPLGANLVLEQSVLSVPEDRQFAIDNSVFSVDLKKATDHKKLLVSNAWETMKQSIAFILDRAAQLKGVKTDAFRVIREKRDLLQMKIVMLQNQTRLLLQRKDELRDIEVKISVISASSAALKSIQESSISTQPELRLEATTYHNTICRACDYVKHTPPVCCHENCGLDFSGIEGDNIFAGCAGIAPSGLCIGSPNCGHHYSRHVHIRQKPVVITKVVNLFTADQLRDLNSLQSAEVLKKSMLQNTKDNLQRVEDDKAEVEKELLICFTELRGVCSDFNYQREVDLSIELVDERLQGANLQPKEANQLKAIKKALLAMQDSLKQIFQLF